MTEKDFRMDALEVIDKEGDVIAFKHTVTIGVTSGIYPVTIR